MPDEPSNIARQSERPKADPAEQAARLARRVFAAEQAATAMLDVETKAVAVRENMARLRQLRLAKEAQEIRTKPAAFEKKKPERRVRLIRVPA